MDKILIKNCIIVFLISLSFVFLSCNESVSKTDFNKILNDAISIQDKVESTAIKRNDITTPLGLVCVDNKYVIGDENKDNILHFFDREGNRLFDMLHRGHGVDELVSINLMQALSSSEFWILDNSMGKILFFSRDSIYSINRSLQVTDYHQLSICRDTIIGICLENDARYKVLNLQNNSVSYMGSYDQFKIDPNIGKQIYQGHIVCNPEKGMFAFLSYYGVSWQFGSYRMGKLCEPEIIEVPDYTVESSGYPIFGLDTKLGFISVACSSTHIYALYSGKRIREGIKNKGAVMQGNTIFRFDWEGNIDACYKINDMTYQIAYDETNEKLVMLSENGNGYLIQTVDCF